MYVAEAKVTEQMAKEVATLLNTAMNSLPLDWPAKVQVGLVSGGNGFFASGNTVFGAYEWNAYNINTGRDMRFDLQTITGFWFHELGHTLFSKLLERQWTEMQSPLPRFDFMSDGEFEKSGLAELNLQLLGQKGVSTERLALEKQIRALSPPKSRNDFYLVTVPYQELIADMVAVILAKSQNPLSLEGDSDVHAPYRSFGRVPLKKGFWMWDLPEHTLFAAVRQNVGLLLDRAETADEIASVATKVIRATLSSLRSLALDPVKTRNFADMLVEFKTGSPSSPATNDRFSQRYNRLFAELNRDLLKRIRFPNSCSLLLMP